MDAKLGTPIYIILRKMNGLRKYATQQRTLVFLESDSMQRLMQNVQRVTPYGKESDTARGGDDVHDAIPAA